MTLRPHRALLVAVGAIILAACAPTQARINEVWTTDDDAVLSVVVSYCDEDVTLRVEETDDSVTLSATYPRQTSQNDCLGAPLTVTLDAPLAEREVIDGSSGTVVPVNDDWPH